MSDRCPSRRVSSPAAARSSASLGPVPAMSRTTPRIGRVETLHGAQRGQRVLARLELAGVEDRDRRVRETERRSHTCSRLRVWRRRQGQAVAHHGELGAQTCGQPRELVALGLRDADDGVGGGDHRAEPGATQTRRQPGAEGGAGGAGREGSPPSAGAPAARSVHRLAISPWTWMRSAPRAARQRDGRRSAMLAAAAAGERVGASSKIAKEKPSSAVSVSIYVWAPAPAWGSTWRTRRWLIRLRSGSRAASAP